MLYYKQITYKNFAKKMPFKTWYKRKSDIFNLHVYSYNAYVVDYKAKAKEKMIFHLQAGTFVGYKAKN